MYMHKQVFTIMAVVMLTPLAAAEQGDAIHPHNCTKKALTVFQDVSAMNRRKGAGENLTELHRKYEAQGWSFDDLEIYIEDGDLEGFFVTYSRAVCKPADESTTG